MTMVRTAMDTRIKEHFPAISPAHNITADDPPTLVLLGSNDKLIPTSTAEKFDADLKQAGSHHPRTSIMVNLMVSSMNVSLRGASWIPS